MVTYPIQILHEKKLCIWFCTPDAAGGGVLMLSAVTLPVMRCRKWKRSERCLSVASFVHFPFFAAQRWVPRRGSGLRSPFFAFFLWRSKERRWLPGHPGKAVSWKKEQHQLSLTNGGEVSLDSSLPGE